MAEKLDIKDTPFSDLNFFFNLKSYNGNAERTKYLDVVRINRRQFRSKFLLRTGNVIELLVKRLKSNEKWTMW